MSPEPRPPNRADRIVAGVTLVAGFLAANAASVGFRSSGSIVFDGRVAIGFPWEFFSRGSSGHFQPERLFANLAVAIVAAFLLFRPVADGKLARHLPVPHFPLRSLLAAAGVFCLVLAVGKGWPEVGVHVAMWLEPFGPILSLLIASIGLSRSESDSRIRMGRFVIIVWLSLVTLVLLIADQERIWVESAAWIFCFWMPQLWILWMATLIFGQLDSWEPVTSE